MYVTQEPTDRGMVVPSPLAWQSIPTRRQPWRWFVTPLVLLVIAFVVLHLVTVDDYGILPGDALPVDGSQGAVTVGSAHPGSGETFLATVLLQSRITEWDRLTHFMHRDEAIVPTVSITGGESSTTYNQQNAEDMSASQEDARVAALRRLGYPVPELGDGALVDAVEPFDPAAGQLRQGDVIVAVNGHVVRVASDLTTATVAEKPGQTLHLTVKRPGAAGGSTLQLAIPTVACGDQNCPNDPDHPIIGVAVETDNQSFSFPADAPAVKITTNGIGGPSAGLAFTLGVIDAVTSQNITGGIRVAATGTIDPDGNVGDVGGVAQKTVAVEEQHCAYFIVPAVEDTAATAAAHGKIKIIPVTTLEQALNFLRSIGGNLSGVPEPAPALPPE
jgi:Lon-like protease